MPVKASAIARPVLGRRPRPSCLRHGLPLGSRLSRLRASRPRRRTLTLVVRSAAAVALEFEKYVLLREPSVLLARVVGLIDAKARLVDEVVQVLRQGTGVPLPLLTIRPRQLVGDVKKVGVMRPSSAS